MVYGFTVYTLERFEDAGLAVLETDHGDSLVVTRAELPPDVTEGDVLTKLPWYRRDGEIRYAVDKTLTAERRSKSKRLRAELPVLQDKGDIEL